MQTFFELDALVKKEDLESWKSTSTKLSLVKWNFANVLSVGARQAEARSAARHSQSSWQPEFIRICIFFRMNFLGRFFYSGLLKTWDGLHNKINTHAWKCLTRVIRITQGDTSWLRPFSLHSVPDEHLGAIDHARLDPVVGMRCVCFRYLVGTYEPVHDLHCKQLGYHIRMGFNILYCTEQSTCRLWRRCQCPQMKWDTTLTRIPACDRCGELFHLWRHNHNKWKTCEVDV